MKMEGRKIFPSSSKGNVCAKYKKKMEVTKAVSLVKHGVKSIECIQSPSFSYLLQKIRTDISFRHMLNKMSSISYTG